MLSMERRRLPRVPVRLPATLLVLIPEAPVYPALHDAVVLDISERGAMVHLSLPEEAYQAICRKSYYFPTGFKNQPDLPCLVGKAAWIKPVMHNGRTEYNIGLHFEECPQPLAEKLRKFVRKTIQDSKTQSGGC